MKQSYLRDITLISREKEEVQERVPRTAEKSITVSNAY